MAQGIGFRVFQNIDRPSKEIIELFRDIPSSNIGDQMGRLYCSNSSLKAMNTAPLLGPAFTVKVPQGDNLMVHYALELAQPGDIIVVDGEGDLSHALLGELMATYARQRGIGGLVLNGCVRDADALAAMDIPVYAIGVAPQGPYKNGPGEINVPVCCAGLAVLPGDIIAGDSDGIVVIRKEDAEELAPAARKKFEGETKTLTEKKFNKSWVYQTIQELNVPIL